MSRRIPSTVLRLRRWRCAAPVVRCFTSSQASTFLTQKPLAVRPSHGSTRRFGRFRLLVVNVLCPAGFSFSEPAIAEARTRHIAQGGGLNPEWPSRFSLKEGALRGRALRRIRHGRLRKRPDQKVVLDRRYSRQGAGLRVWLGSGAGDPHDGPRGVAL